MIYGFMSMLWPRLCPVCGRTLGRGETLMCAPCLAAAPRTGMHRSRGLDTLESRIARPGHPLAIAAAWLDYNRHSPYAALVRDAKFHYMPRLAREAGRIFGAELMADCSEAISDIDVLLPVPLHWRRLLSRGYNQSHEIALGLSEATGIPVGDNLTATRHHRAQTRSNAALRAANVRGLIAVANAAELDGLHVAVVDDVVTSGATMREALAALEALERPPRAFSVLALAAVGGSAWHFPEKNS